MTLTEATKVHRIGHANIKTEFRTRQTDGREWYVVYVWDVTDDTATVDMGRFETQDYDFAVRLFNAMPDAKEPV